MGVLVFLNIFKIKYICITQQESTMFFKTIKEGKFEYIKEGNGHPLVLLHGLMGGLSNFSELTNHFASKGYTVYIPQLPIYDLPILKTNVKNIAKFVVKFLEAKVGEPATLIGNSLGGHVGLVTTVLKPELVHSVVLTGSSGLFEKSLGQSFPKRDNYEYVKRKSQEVFYDPNVASKEIVDEVFKTVNDRNKAIRTLYIARSAIKHNMTKNLPDISQPVCIIWGKNDSVTPPEVAIEFDRLLPNSTLHWIDKCGHVAMMEHPKLFNELLEDCLKEIKTEAAI